MGALTHERPAVAQAHRAPGRPECEPLECQGTVVKMMRLLSCGRQFAIGDIVQRGQSKFQAFAARVASETEAEAFFCMINHKYDDDMAFRKLVAYMLEGAQYAHDGYSDAEPEAADGRAISVVKHTIEDFRSVAVFVFRSRPEGEQGEHIGSIRFQLFGCAARSAVTQL